MKIRMYCLFVSAIFLSLQVKAAEEKDASAIPPIIVKASNKVSRGITSGPKTILTHQQLQATGAATLAEALQNLGGVQVRDVTGNGSQVALSMRGFGSNATSNTLLLINGIPITNPDLAPPNLNIIPLPEIEYIEIIAGSESVLYGDQAVAGAINIITNQRTQEKIDASCSAGSYNQYYCYAALANHYNNLRYNIMASNNRTDNYRNHNDYDQNILLGMFDYAYATGRLRFNYNVSNEDMQYPGALTAKQVRENRRQANNNTDFFTDWSGFYQLFHQQSLTPNWRLTTSLARREMWGHGVLTSPFRQSRLIYYIRPTLKGTVNTSKIAAGLDAESDYYHLSSLFGLTNNHQQKYGLFGVATLPLYHSATLSIGARGAQQNSMLQSFTNNNTINRALATTLGIAFPVTSTFDFYLRRAESFRFPKADENAFAPIGVAGLRTQRGVSYEAGTEWNSLHYSGKASLYQLNLRDEIAFDPTQTPQQPFGANRNLSPTLRRGFTLSNKDQITDCITLGWQYNYVNARFQNGVNSGNRIPLVAENILLLNLNYKIKEYWNIYSEAIYTGSQFPANDDANVAGKIGGYTVYNLSLRYEIKNLTLSLRVNNMFNKFYYFYTVYQSSIKSEFFYPAPGRNFLFTLKYAFL